MTTKEKLMIERQVYRDVIKQFSSQPDIRMNVKIDEFLQSIEDKINNIDIQLNEMEDSKVPPTTNNGVEQLVDKVTKSILDMANMSLVEAGFTTEEDKNI